MHRHRRSLRDSGEVLENPELQIDASRIRLMEVMQEVSICLLREDFWVDYRFVAAVRAGRSYGWFEHE